MNQSKAIDWAWNREAFHRDFEETFDKSSSSIGTEVAGRSGLIANDPYHGADQIVDECGYTQSLVAFTHRALR